MKSRVIFSAAALAMLTANAVSATDLYNVFLSGKVFEGDRVITTFAAPILAGRTFPLRDLESEGSAGSKGLQLELTPESSSVEKHVRVAVKASWGEGGPSESVSGGVANQDVDLAQGESKIVSFDCANAADNPPRCKYKLVLSANLLR